MEMIYFDHNATAPYSPSVREYLQTGMLEDWQQPLFCLSTGTNFGAEESEECKRAYVADRLNCSPRHLFFTSGGTESINTILSSGNFEIEPAIRFYHFPFRTSCELKKI